VIYLYPSQHAADEGISVGGSGFLVAITTERLPGGRFVYAVTNSHVIEGGSCVVRLNTTDGGKDVLEFKQSSWTRSQTDDLAVRLMPNVPNVYSTKAIPHYCFVTKDDVFKHNIGIGDEVLVFGRFINHEGKQQNRPIVRFGHISQNPHEPVEYIIRSGRAGNVKTRVHSQESFLAEVKSIGGYSGSPVLLLPNPSDGRWDHPPLDPDRCHLLGVDWGHILDYEDVRTTSGDISPSNMRVHSNTGIMGVIPAWKLWELLMSDKLVRERHALEEIEVERRSGPKAAADVPGNIQPETSENPTLTEMISRAL
jgi:hypothetical protein